MSLWLYRCVIRIALGLMVSVLLAACGGQSGTGTVDENANQNAPLNAVLAASELVVGSNRLPIGIVQSGSPLNDPAVKMHLRIFDLADTSQTVRSETDAVYRGEGLPFGLYVAYPTFDTPGAWGIEVQMTDSDGQVYVNRLRVEVLAQSSTPAVGSPAIPSTNLTANEEPDLGRITSDGQPDPDLYQLTIADAITAKRPFLVAFSTPGFCKTAVCGPNLQVIKQVKEQFKGQVDFIHVEVYPYPYGESFQQERFVPAMEEWRLVSEPWTFLVDAQGIIQAKYEGGITVGELELALTQLAAGQPMTPVP